MQKKKYNILAFDSWTGGVSNLSRLVKPFKNVGLNLCLLHLGEWGDDKHRPKTEKINGLRVENISNFKNQTFYQILKNKKPDAVLFLSTESLPHITFLSICRKLKIPTVHLFHGIHGIFTTKFGQQFLETNIFTRILFILKRIPKFAKYTLPNFLKQYSSLQKPFEKYSILLKAIKHRLSGIDKVIQTYESRADICCLYIKSEIEAAKKRWGYKSKSLKVVGNPDIINFNLKKEDIGCSINKIEKNKSICYIESGLSDLGVGFSNDQEYTKFLVSIKKSLPKKMLFFVKIKPVPFARYHKITKILKSKKIKILSSKNFVEKLKKCSLCIIEPSTASLIPCYLGMQIFINKIGPLKNLVPGNIFKTYPFLKTLNSLDQKNLFKQSSAKKNKIKKFKKWCANNLGPLPAQKMPYRVARAVKQLIAQKLMPYDFKV